MKRLCAALLAFALPLPPASAAARVAVSVQAPRAPMGSIPLAASNAPTALPLALSAPSLSGLNLPALSAPSMRTAGVIQAGAAAQTSAISAATHRIQPEKTATPAAPRAAVQPLKIHDSKNKPAAAGKPQQQGRPAVSAQVQAQAALPRLPSLSGLELRGLSQKVFDGSGRGRKENPAVAASALLAAPSGLVQRHADKNEAPDFSVPAPEKSERKPLPWGYRFFLGGLLLSSIGQAISTVLVPLMAHGLSPELAALSQAAGLLAVIPGSMIGVWWVRRFGSRHAHISANVLNAAVFASLPLAAAFLGAVSPLHLIVFSATSGIQYGALRGVAEQDIAVRVLGQDEELLRKAGALYYIFVSPAYMATSMAVGFLLAHTGTGPFSIAGALTMLASALPFWFVRYRHEGKAGEAREPEEKKEAPAGAWVPYLYFWTVHYGFYYLFAPFFALEIFHADSLNGWFVGLYALGNMLFSWSHVFLPKWTNRIPKKAWTYFGLLASLSFMWSALALGSQTLALASVLLMGAGTAAGLIQWRAYYQNRLPVQDQPKAFSRMNTATVLINLVPLLMLYAAGLFFPGLSIHAILAVSAAAATAAAVFVAARLKRLI